MNISQAFICNTCGCDVRLEHINADDLAYVCCNSRCKRTVSVDTPEALRQRIVEADAAGRRSDTYDLAINLMGKDEAVNLAVCSILEITMDIVDHQRRRTAVMDAVRYEAIAA